MSALLHIASLVVHHRIEAGPALDAALRELPDTELALREGGRSVIVCEGGNEGELMDRIQVLRDLDGVIGVSLVHHHAESRARLSEEIDHDHTP